MARKGNIEDGPAWEIVSSVCKDRFLNNEIITNVQRMLTGDTTFVFRINTTEKTYYARFISNDGRFNIELLIHKILREHNISVPKILFFEEENKQTGLSFMLEEEMPGASLEDNYPQEKDLKNILFVAGQQLAQINSIPVINGFGVFDVCSKTELKGRENSYEEYFFCSFEKYLNLLDTYPFTKKEKSYIRELIKTAKEKLNVVKPFLATGDFSLDHIFHFEGKYSGIIDLGKACGNNRLYDLGNITAFYQNRTILKYLLEGYKTIEPLGEDILHSIELMSLCILVRMLGLKANTNRSSYWYKLMKQQLKTEYEV